MTFPYIAAINLIPASGEFTYDTVAYSGRLPGASSFSPINTYHASGGSKTDFSYALDQLQATLPNCNTVAVVIQWMGNSLNLASCQVYPSTTYWQGSQVGAFEPTAGGTDSWRVSGLTLADCNNGLIPISRNAAGQSAYGGTPSDQSVVRCLQAIKARGLKAALYLQMNMDVTGQPWRGLVTYSPDISSAASTAVSNFLGSAAVSNFSQNFSNLTVSYINPSLPSNGKFDFTYRRFVLHYANLCVVAGGVSLFAIGSELRGVEAIRGPSWTAAGTTDGGGNAVWDYPFVAGLITLANDCRSVFDAAGLVKNLVERQNLITYSPDWSQWMGVQYVGAPGTASGSTGIWPHLDSLFAAGNIDFVSFDNYLPLSDWTTGNGGLDALNWSAVAPTSWPVASPDTIGLGLSGTPTLYSIPYLQSQIEGGEKFNYFYASSTSAKALDPKGTLQYVQAPQSDRLGQSRNRFYAGQQLFAFKQIRWWWNNLHKALYDAGDGAGIIPRGPQTEWAPQSKSIGFLEYGFPTLDKSTNEPNLFYDPNSVSGGIPFWSVMTPGGVYPVVDDTIALMAHEAFNTYWVANNAVSSAGVSMIATDLMFAWTWDARPLPEFPLRTDIWADGAKWRYGHWLNGKLPALPPPAATPAPTPGPFQTFPTLPGLTWSMTASPRFATERHDRASGKSSRRMKMRHPVFDIELAFDVLRSDAAHLELQTLLGFFESVAGQALPFWFTFPSLSNFSAQQIATGDGVTTTFSIPSAALPLTIPAPGLLVISNVYVGGILQASSAWSLQGSIPPKIAFTSAPANGVAIATDAVCYWLCRFKDDSLDFEQFAASLFELKKVKLQTVKDLAGGPIGVDQTLGSMFLATAQDFGAASSAATAFSDWGPASTAAGLALDLGLAH